MDHTERIVLLVDMDCFYCQVEEVLNPELKGKPIAVVQHNSWKGGGIIAVNYPARYKGVTRHMRGNEAKEKCPEIVLVRVPNFRGKADLSKYRDAGKRVADFLLKFTKLLERASVDEAYLDITDSVCERISLHKDLTSKDLPNTKIVGYDHVDHYLTDVSDLHNDANLKLAIGGMIAEEIRRQVFEETGYTCSAGIAHNKILAKLVCGLHKPNQQTILPQENVAELYEKIPVKKIKSLGGKFGSHLSEKLKITNMIELARFTKEDLIKSFDEKTGCWLYNIARGIDLEPVTTRLISKSIGCCKKFAGKASLTTIESVQHWLKELSIEMAVRLEEDVQDNNRKPRQMVVSYVNKVGRKDVSCSRTHPISSVETDYIMGEAFKVLTKNGISKEEKFCLQFLGLSAGKFDEVKKSCDITTFFKKAEAVNEIRDLDEGNTTKSAIENNQIHEVNKPIDLDENTNVSLLNQTENSNEVSIERFVENVNEVSEESADSITDEIAEKSVPSFFQNYLKTDAVERNFDTSVILEENIDDIIDEVIDDELQDIKSEVVATTSNNNISDFQMDDDGSVQNCPQCNKKIASEDMVSHMDYHFALKIVSDESHLYKRPVQSKENIKNTPKRGKEQTLGKKQTVTSSKDKQTVQSSKTKKRKSDTKCLKLTNFFASRDGSVEDDSNSTVCSLCKLKIGVQDFDSHMDYHFAKKIHLELNPPTTVIGKTNKVAQSKKKNGAGDITNFFKSQ
ncbi:PREDICTED: DNA polymerase eta [Nicrophorus vespilloides]|uniref:DNA polymerase eta n=1 Tax=Nicrophorus vespilloides TaxID=110193 RepID=A0ABM1M6R5_NICVS|nr:PREDICTED: DNA polymerase eta [Nicrophorus vespilloides]